MSGIKITSSELPGLYQSADQASLDAQKNYFRGLKWYLLLLICAAFASYARPSDIIGALLSAGLFLITLGILIFLRVKRPDDVWYNGRAVAESVKTRSWRWMMRADPYEDCENIEIISKQFINDLKAILDQNKSLSHSLQSTDAVNEPISQVMKEVRALPVLERLAIYLDQRIQNQANWYWSKSRFNKRRAQQWFWVSVFLHASAIGMLLYKIKDPAFSLPVEVVATAAGAALTWLQAKKHNELNSAYALAAHEIVLIKGESTSVRSEQQLSEYVVNSEAAFSREHTQWVARKGD
ncbi:DUF4231 domain-containing protein [Methylocaldum sp.]|uniref:DUF4231 domain-containing protein n=1 Tax=Methylocaldum sp. TaxID=1969727 RepID=UPI00321FA435